VRMRRMHEVNCAEIRDIFHLPSQIIIFGFEMLCSLLSLALR
jgi:hypothetical protein